MADRFDLDAIDADDALLDLLAAGGDSARSAGEHDPAVALLAELRLAVEVEGELPVETIDDPESFLARCAALNPITDPFARKVAARGVALGVAAVAALSVSGVAAAVNGDPLSPYEKVIEKMVDAVRPQTSFPKEQLDGMPVVDKTKIVKVAKDFKQRQQEAKLAAEDRVVQNDVPIPPASVVQKALPEVLRVQPPQQPTVTKIEPTVPETTKAPEKTDNTPSDDPTQPTDTTTTAPTDPTTTEPTQPPATTEPPTADPTDPATTPPAEEQPTTPPPDTGDTGTGNSETGTGNPTTAPSGDTSQNGDTTAPGSDNGTPTQSDDTGSNTGGTDQSGTDQSGTVQTPSDDAPSADTKDPVTGLLDTVIAPILPTLTGAPAEDTTAQQFFGEGAQAAAKHSTGQTTSGSVKQVYPTGKHSTGQYAEGKHAAIARAHGSTADADVLKILEVVNTPTK